MVPYRPLLFPPCSPILRPSRIVILPSTILCLQSPVGPVTVLMAPCYLLSYSTSSCPSTANRVVPHCVSRPVVRLPPCLPSHRLLCFVRVGHSPEGDPDALDIPIPRTHAEAFSGPWASYWIAAEEAEMASYRSIGTYVNAVPPHRTNIVSGMWLYKVKRPPRSPPVFKARYVARGFSQREGVDFFQTFVPTPKMTTLWVLLHIVAQRDYELHSLDFSTEFLQGSLHEQIWLRGPLGLIGSFPPGTQWQLRRSIYGLHQALCGWHDTLGTNLAAPDFFPSSANPSIFVCRGSTPFFVLLYVDDLVFATPDQRALAYVKEELQRRHTCTDLGELQRYLGLHITRDRAICTIILTQSHMVEQILTRFRFPFSKVQLTPLAVHHRLTLVLPHQVSLTLPLGRTLGSVSLPTVLLRVPSAAFDTSANIVDAIWIFKVKRPPGLPPVFKACYVARGFSQREGVEFFETFALTPKMTTLRVLLHVAAQRDYELHSLDFSTAFL
ncbi:unnamed protein product [Closterium sp. NIES-54]